MRHKVKKRRFERVWANISVCFSQDEKCIPKLEKTMRTLLCLLFSEEAAADVLIFTVFQSFRQLEVTLKPCSAADPVSLIHFEKLHLKYFQSILILRNQPASL